jgi:adenine/guanine phosphoribosyltransferase-like PRPP-binding protein
MTGCRVLNHLLHLMWRITFTKRIRDIFSVEIGDMIEIYQNLKNSDVIFTVKRKGIIINTLGL